MTNDLENNVISLVITNIQDCPHRWLLSDGTRMYNNKNNITLYYSSDWRYTGFSYKPKLTRYNAKRLHEAIKSWYYHQIFQKLLPERSEE